MKQMKTLLGLGFSSLFLVLIGGATALATITIGQPQGVSNVTGLAVTSSGTATASATPSTTQGAISIYGGTAGSSTNCSGTGLCNSCQNYTTTLNDCNQFRIIPTTVITIPFTSSTVTGIPAINAVSSDGNSTVTTIAPVGGTGTTSVNQGTATNIAVPWSEICPSLVGAVDSTQGGDNTCTPVAGNPLTGQFRIGIMANGDQQLSNTADDYVTVTFTVATTSGTTANSTFTGTAPDTQTLALNCDNPAAVGICGFSVYPGDQKATLRDVQALNGFPTNAGINFAGVQLFYSTTSFESITSSSSSQFLGLNPNATSLTFQNAEVTGLSNSSRYYFKIAAVDLAQNIAFFTNDSDDNYCKFATSPNIQSQCHEAAPAPVYGVLGKSINCFIATAAYGSPLAPQVGTFREFRNRFLLHSEWGQRFVRFYYAESPKYAKIIAKNDLLRACVRLMLWPVLAFVSMSLKFGLINTLLMIFAVVAIPISLYVLRQNRGARA